VIADPQSAGRRSHRWAAHRPARSWPLMASTTATGDEAADGDVGGVRNWRQVNQIIASPPGWDGNGGGLGL